MGQAPGVEVSNPLVFIRVRIVTGDSLMKVPSAFGVRCETNIVLRNRQTGAQYVLPPAARTTAFACHELRRSSATIPLEAEISLKIQLQDDEQIAATPVELSDYPSSIQPGLINLNYETNQSTNTMTIDVPDQQASLIGTPFYATQSDCEHADWSDSAVWFEV